MKSVIASVAAAVVLSACGGGNDPDLRQGLYLGKSFSTFNTGSDSFVLVLENHEAWVVAGSLGQGIFDLRSGLTFTASNAVVTIAGPELGRQPMTLSVAGDGSLLQAAVPSHPQSILPVVSLVTPAKGYDYDRPARLQDVQGNWSSVTVSGTGAVAGTNLGCTLAGTLTPRPGGKNIFDASFSLADCDRAGAYTGVAVTYMDTSGNDAVNGPFTVPTLRLMGLNEGKTRMGLPIMQK
jgi:hypothetical protein